MAVKQVEVDKKKADAEVIAADVTVEKAKVEKENDKAQIEATSCAAIAKNANEQKAYAEGELSKAAPLVEKALAALKSLNKADF